MKKILFTILCLGIIRLVTAQNIDSYELKLPSYIVNGVHNIAVYSYESQEDVAGVAEEFSLRLTGTLRSKSYGMNNKGIFMNPWLTACLNEVELLNPSKNDDASILEAAKGKNVQAAMLSSFKVEEDYSEHEVIIKGKSSEGIPYKRKSYELKRTVKVKGETRILSTEDGSVIKAWDVQTQKSSEDKVYDYPQSGKLLSKSKLAKEAGLDLSQQFTNIMKAQFVSHKYDFMNIRKIKDKELKALDKEVAKMLRKTPKENFKIIYSKMLEMEKVGFPDAEDNAKLFYNIALMNEMAGNYEMAKTYYEKCRANDPTEKDYIKAMEHIEALLKVKALFQNQGYETMEYKF